MFYYFTTYIVFHVKHTPIRIGILTATCQISSSAQALHKSFSGFPSEEEIFSSSHPIYIKFRAKRYFMSHRQTLNVLWQIFLLSPPIATLTMYDIVAVLRQKGRGVPLFEGSRIPIKRTKLK